MKPKCSLRFWLYSFGTVLLTFTAAHADTIYWDGGNGTWNTAANWSTASGATTPDPSAVPGAADDAIFNISTVDGAQNITLDANQLAQSLTFDNTGITNLRGNISGTTARTLTVGTGGVTANTGAGAVTIGETPGTFGAVNLILASPQSWTNHSTNLLTFTGTVTNGGNLLTVAGSGNTTIGGVVSGTGSLTKTGAGVLTLSSNASTYSGQLTVANGALAIATINNISSNGVLGNSALPVILGSSGGNTGILRSTVNNGATTKGFTMATGGTGAFDVRANNLTLSGVIDGAGGLTKIGTGELRITNNSNSYSGATTINAGILNLGNAGATGALASTVLNLGGGTLSYTRTGNTTQSFTTTNFTAGSSSVSVAAGNTLGLGTLGRTVGGTVNFGSTGTTTTSTANNIVGADGILGGWAVHNGANWAVNAAGSVTGGATYVTTTTGGATAGNYTSKNMDVTTSPGVMSDIITPNSIRFNDNVSARTLTLAAGDNVITTGGILVTTTVGNRLSTITGGNLAGSSGGDLVVNQYNTSNGLTIASLIKNNSTATGLTKSGGGLLTLSNTGNSYTGGTHLNQGTVDVTSLDIGGNASSIGASGAAASNLVFNGGALRYVGAGNAATDRNFTIRANGATIDASSSSTGSLTWSGSTAYDVANEARTLTLQGNANGATNVFSGQITDNGSGPVTLVKNTNGNIWSLTNSNNNFSGGVQINRGTLIFSSGALGTGPISITSNAQNITLRWASGNTEDISSRWVGGANANPTIFDTGANNVTFASSFVGSANDGTYIVKDGAGKLTLTASSTSVAPLIIREGTLAVNTLANGGTVSSIGRSTSDAATLGLRGGTLQYLGAGSETNRNFNLAVSSAIDASGTGALVFTETGLMSPTPAGRPTITWGSGANSLTTGNTAALVVGMAVAGTGIQPGTTITAITNNNGFNISLPTTSAGTGLTFGNYSPGTPITLTLTGTNTDANEIRGVLSNSVSGIAGDPSFTPLGISKTGTGTWLLSGTNTYTGATTVNQGTLLINGSTSTSLVTVGASGTLGGNGTVGGATTVTGTLSPGNSVTPAATLTLGSTLTLNSGAILALGLGTTSDLIDFTSVTNNLIGSGNATLQISQLAGFSYANTYTIFQDTSTTGFTLAGITGYDNVGYTANFFESGDNYLLSFTAVPEPSAAILGGLGLLALLRRRR